MHRSPRHLQDDNRRVQVNAATIYRGTFANRIRIHSPTVGLWILHAAVRRDPWGGSPLTRDMRKGQGFGFRFLEPVRLFPAENPFDVVPNVRDVIVNGLVKFEALFPDGDVLPDFLFQVLLRLRAF